MSCLSVFRALPRSRSVFSFRGCRAALEIKTARATTAPATTQSHVTSCPAHNYLGVWPTPPILEYPTKPTPTGHTPPPDLLFGPNSITMATIKPTGITIATTTPTHVSTAKDTLINHWHKSCPAPQWLPREMEAGSVLKKRRRKMNQHKYRKWRKKHRFLRRRLGR